MSDKREQLCTAMESLDLGEVQRILDETPSLLRERLRPDAGRGGDVMSLAALTNSPELLELLHRRGGDVMENSNNPLNRAATKGNLIASMETLVRLGADVDQPAEDYGPPIIFAIEGGSLDSMRSVRAGMHDRGRAQWRVVGCAEACGDLQPQTSWDDRACLAVRR